MYVFSDSIILVVLWNVYFPFYAYKYIKKATSIILYAVYFLDDF